MYLIRYGAVTANSALPLPQMYAGLQLQDGNLLVPTVVYKTPDPATGVHKCHVDIVDNHPLKKEFAELVQLITRRREARARVHVAAAAGSGGSGSGV